MTNEVLLGVHLLVGLVLLGGATRSNLSSSFIAFSLVNMMMISVFGSKLITISGMITNVGNVPHALLLASQWMIVHRYGSKVGAYSVCILLAALGFLFASTQMVDAYIGTGGRASAAISVLASAQNKVALASAASTGIILFVLAIAYEHLRGCSFLLRYTALCVVLQGINTWVFFTLAFPQLTVYQHLAGGLVTGGFIIKLAVILFTTPLIYLAAKEES